MKCQKCGAEFVDGIAVCSDCHLPLIDAVEFAEEPGVSPQWVQVYETGDPGLISLIKSLFEGNNIPCFVRGEDLQNLFALGILGTGFNPVAQSAKVLVLENDVEKAMEILSLLEEEVLEEDGIEADELNGEDEDEE